MSYTFKVQIELHGNAERCGKKIQLEQTSGQTKIFIRNVGDEPFTVKNGEVIVNFPVNEGAKYEFEVGKANFHTSPIIAQIRAEYDLPFPYRNSRQFLRKLVDFIIELKQGICGSTAEELADAEAEASFLTQDDTWRFEGFEFE